VEDWWDDFRRLLQPDPHGVRRVSAFQAADRSRPLLGQRRAVALGQSSRPFPPPPESISSPPAAGANTCWAGRHGAGAQQGPRRDGGGGPLPRRPRKERRPKWKSIAIFMAFTWKKGVNDPSRGRRRLL